MMDLRMDTDAAARDIARWADGLGKDVVPQLRQHANRVADRTKSSLPRRSGRLAGSVSVTSDVDSAEVQMGAPYARFVEHGGRGFPHSALGNYMGAASRGLEPSLEPTMAAAAEASIAGYSWSR